MACYIFGAGDFDGLEERPGAEDYVIAADGGYTACRRAGVEPQLLLEKVLRDVKSAGYPSILLWVFDANLPAIRFYRSLGFTANGRKRPSFGSVEEMYTKAL